MTDAATISCNFERVRGAIAEAAVSAGRPADAVKLVAVSKTHPAEAVEHALQAGQRLFGENRVQEAKAKFPALRAAHPDLRLHLIGPLQTNKVKEAVALFDVIESVDRPKLAHALAEEMARSGRRPRMLVQVNIGEEPQKAGVDPSGLDALVALVREDLGLPLDGLMCIPPAGTDPAPFFARLAAMADRHGLAVRSMGMSGDFAAAIAQGATHVRVGTALFGSRPPAA